MILCLHTAWKCDEMRRPQHHPTSLGRGLILLLLLALTHLTEAQLNVPCALDSDCVVVANAICLRKSPTCQRGSCECASGFRQINGFCIRETQLGQACTGADVCTGNNMACTNGICQCDRGYKGPGPKGNDCVSYLEQSALGGLCYDDAACYYKLFCQSNKCQCRAGYKPTSGEVDCEPKVPGDTCIDSSECEYVRNSYCASGRCTCISGYKSTVYSTETDRVAACVPAYEELLGLGQACVPAVQPTGNRLCQANLKCLVCPENIYTTCVAEYPIAAAAFADELSFSFILFLLLRYV